MDGLDTKVLLIDDEEAFVSALEKRLTTRNVKVLTAHTGEQGLEQLSTEPDVDVVLLDVKMPGMDGIATLREIKKSHPIVEVIMLTGHATVESAIDGMRLGAHDYLMKPCDVEELMAKIKDAKLKKQAHQERILDAAGKELLHRRGL
ncbi:MAG: response regulator [Desulfomonile tiedjei]|uniref:Response regulator n=1 Tax=Desulfomonile tiedjei TaxID=2358 RepID=A0A9D6V4G5_9BACT|nr:response regulator [Desulfomonile tiedjei]